MGNLDYQRTIIGYHGCDKAVADKVFTEDGKLEYSENRHDWLGKGIYFWEYGKARANEWARWRSSAIGGPGVKITNPSVVGAYIHLGNCFDLLDSANTHLLGEMYKLYKQDREKDGAPIPRNTRSSPGDIDHTKRLLDCAVVNYAIAMIEKTEGTRYDTVRCIFSEGKPAFDGSFIMDKSHVQIAVRSEAAILGYFKPIRT